MFSHPGVLSVYATAGSSSTRLTALGEAPKAGRLWIVAADLSLRCPGFAVLQYEGGKVSIERLCHLDNRRSRAGHGEILSAIYNFITG